MCGEGFTRSTRRSFSRFSQSLSNRSTPSPKSRLCLPALSFSSCFLCPYSRLQLDCCLSFSRVKGGLRQVWPFSCLSWCSQVSAWMTMHGTSSYGHGTSTFFCSSLCSCPRPPLSKIRYGYGSIHPHLRRLCCFLSHPRVPFSVGDTPIRRLNSIPGTPKRRKLFFRRMRI